MNRSYNRTRDIKGMVANQAGFTLMETILAIILGVGVMAFAAKFGMQGYDSYRVKRMVDQVQLIQSAMSKAADINGSYASITKIDDLLNFGLDADAKTSPFGAAVAVVGSAYSYVITFPTTPSFACAQMVKRYPSDVTQGATKTTCGTGSTKSSVVLEFTSNG
ncbi:TPA: hypothetical protein ACJ51G_000981 [Aeromonas hydrophila subsp. hydrophila]|uniref:type II secretion system protein n=1 Tax=Aeromonas caviae TaxID=648 RepID=UPI000FEBD404|nr:hypothetical protein [Aeromonas caviae]RWT75373.1 hypothetical protein DN604_12295 [Aeromonas caviae]